LSTGVINALRVPDFVPLDEGLPKLEDAFCYKFHEPNYLLAALTCKSYKYENPKECRALFKPPFYDNVTMALIGDNVAKLSLTMLHAEDGGGLITRRRNQVESDVTFAKAAVTYGVDDVRRTGGGWWRYGNELKAKATAFEAVLGAIFLDAGGQSIEPILRVMRKLKADTEAIASGDVHEPSAEHRLLDYCKQMKIGLPIFNDLGTDGGMTTILCKLTGDEAAQFIAEASTRKMAIELASEGALKGIERAAASALKEKSAGTDVVHVKKKSAAKTTTTKTTLKTKIISSSTIKSRVRRRRRAVVAD
jgi:dsRNA-specific ribonuclease